MRFYSRSWSFFDRTDYERRCNAIFDGVYCWLRGNVSNIYIVKGAGAGDVKLSAVCGMLLGIKGVLIMIISSLICAAVVGTAGIAMKLYTLHDLSF